MSVSYNNEIHREQAGEIDGGEKRDGERGREWEREEERDEAKQAH